MTLALDLSQLVFISIIVALMGFSVLALLLVVDSKWYAAYKIREAAKREQRRKEIEAKNLKKAAEELEKIAAQTKAVLAPPAVPLSLPPGATQGEITSLSEFPIGQKIDIELTRLVKGTLQRVTVAKGKVAIKSGTRPIKLPKLLFFIWQKGAQYYIDPKKIIKVTSTVKGKLVVTYKLVFDILYGEALNQDGTLTWDDDLELILADSGLDQYVTIAAFEGSFQITPTLRNVMIIVAVLGLVFGVALNGVEHFIPQTVVHWVP